MSDGDEGDGYRVARWRRAGVAVALLAVALVAACTTGPAPVTPPPPPAPPAACLLDTAALAASTGLTWTPDASTASDTRCVYDPAAHPAADGPAFVAVDLAPAQDPAAELDRVGALCEEGSRAAVATGGGGEGNGFVCRFQGGNVFAAAAHGGQVVTISTSAVPQGTTAAKLVVAFDQQLTTLGR